MILYTDIWRSSWFSATITMSSAYTYYFDLVGSLPLIQTPLESVLYQWVCCCPNMCIYFANNFPYFLGIFFWFRLQTLEYLAHISSWLDQTLWSYRWSTCWALYWILLSSLECSLVSCGFLFYFFKYRTCFPHFPNFRDYFFFHYCWS